MNLLAVNLTDENAQITAAAILVVLTAGYAFSHLARRVAASKVGQAALAVGLVAGSATVLGWPVPERPARPQPPKVDAFDNNLRADQIATFDKRLAVYERELERYEASAAVPRHPVRYLEPAALVLFLAGGVVLIYRGVAEVVDGFPDGS